MNDEMGSDWIIGCLMVGGVWLFVMLVISLIIISIRW